jgi:arylsulfatase A-like enzyme
VLARTLPLDRTRPAFFYSLPQNVHMGVASKRAVPAGETYAAGFYDRVASSVRGLDVCIGRFVDLLKRQQIYDDSVIILTSDHGDLLGEEGRWGHAFWMYPEVMRVPMIVRVPPWLKRGVRTDLDAVVFSTDIAPSLYRLLGYDPEDLGPLFGRSFFTGPYGDSSRRRGEPMLLASSYGAVYGVLNQNGRRMYVVDTVDQAEYALDLTAEPRRVAVTPSLMAVNRRRIDQQLTALAKVYHYRP